MTAILALSLVVSLTATDPSLVLAEAIRDEQHSRAFYGAAILAFGDKPPFGNIVHAENHHVRLLEGQFNRLGLPVPPDPYARTKDESARAWQARLKVPTDYKSALEAARKGEEDNVRLLDRLILRTDDREVVAVLEKLRDDSRDRHLPAFTRAANGQGHGPGSGRRPGRGPGG